MDETGWIMIFASGREQEAAIIKGMLEEEGITAVIFNKKDSAYLFGELEIYVKQEDALRARQLIQSALHE
jgi:hypothetical protein